MGIGKDIIAGAVGGMVSTLFCHPLDTVRTRLQIDGMISEQGNLISSSKERTRYRYKNALDCTRQIVRREGLRALYSGMSGPLAAQGVYKAIMFGAFGFSKREIMTARPYLLVEQNKGNRNSNVADVKLNILGIYICGGFGGCINALVVTPVELIRNRLIFYAAQNKKLSTQPNSVAACIKQVVRNEGGVLALWKGLHVTMMRDGIGVGAWFAAYEISRRFLEKNEMSGPLPVLFSGACGGVAFWLVALPFDSIKSIIQTARVEVREDCASQTSIRMVAKLIRGETKSGMIQTIASLYKGFPVAVARGIPGAGIVFLAQQQMHQLLNTLEYEWK